MRIRNTLALAALTSGLFHCASSGMRPRPIPEEWVSVTPTAKIDGISYDSSGILTFHERVPSHADVSAVEVADGMKLVRGGRGLTPAFARIDSFDVSDERKEIVFSAKRGSSFDIGLVSIDGSDIHWVPEDPADEIAVQWAPRGNKVSYTVRGRGGDFVRTVHIPTATQLTVDFPSARVRSLAWEPRAERYSVLLDSVDAAQRVETMKYDGSDRRENVRPSPALDVSVEPVEDGFLLRPNVMRYGETLPIVIWLSEDPMSWDDARGELLRSAQVACLVVRRVPKDEAWLARPWLDRSNVFFVNSGGDRLESLSHTEIRGDASVPGGRYIVNRNVVSVAPAVVKSFAARYIADSLKGSSPLHGSH